MLKYVVEVKASNRSTAGFGKWGHPGRIWVRGYGEATKPLYERTIGFVDLRYKGKRSYFYEVYREANWSVPFPVDTNLRWIIATKEQCS